MKATLLSSSHIIFMLVLAEMQHAFGARYYLLNYPSNSNAPSPRELTAHCPRLTERSRCKVKSGWVKKSSHWKIDEHNLSEDCCSLESVDVPFPIDLTVPKLLHVEIIVRLTECRTCRNDCNQENNCLEKLNICIESGINDEGCKYMTFKKSGNRKFDFKLPLKDKDSEDATLKLIVKDFNGEISMVVFYFDYCVVNQHTMVFAYATAGLNV